MLKSLGLIAACSLTFTRLHAQSEPFLHASAGAAYVLLQSVEDGRTRSKWDFRGATQLRGSIEMRIAENTTLGLTYGSASVPLTYQRYVGASNPNNVCPISCSADANFQSFGGALRLVSGTGVHQIVEMNAGVNVFRDFRDRASDTELHVAKGDRDIGFTVGYGVGYTALRRMSVSLVGDIGFTIHHRSGPAAELTELNPIIMARLLFRAGFGG